MVELVDQYGDQLGMFDLELMNLTFSKIKPIAIDYCVLERLLYGAPTTTADWQMLLETHGEDALVRAIDDPKIVHYAGHPVKVWNRMEQPEDYLRYVKRSPFSQRCYQLISRKKKMQRHLWFYILLSKLHPRKKRRRDLRDVLRQIRHEKRAKSWATPKYIGASLP